MHIDIKPDLLNYLSRKEDPTGIGRILRELGFDTSDRQYVRSILNELVREGKLVKDGRKYWIPDGKQVTREIKREKHRRNKQMVGRLSVARQGFGFVANPDGDDWFVPPHAIGNAANGDTVLAELGETDGRGRSAARILKIESFGESNVLGVFVNQDNDLSFVPFGNFQLDLENVGDFPREAKPGDVGVLERVKSDHWRFREILGHMNDVDIDERVAIAENDIATEFPPTIDSQLEGLHVGSPFYPKGREDFRDKLVFTIDGATAKDFDDALHFEKIGNDRYEVGVHIADVAHFVPPESPLDQWASQQGNSTYFPHKAFPMLPKILANNLCSLRPDEDRYTLSLVAEVDGRGVTKDFRLTKGLIRSAHRLTYDQVYQMSVLENQELRAEQDPALLEALNIGLSLSRGMRKRRFGQEGHGVSLDMAEVRVSLDEQMRVDKVSFAYQNDANKMIEAFMCFANERVAEYMTDRGITIPYRVHNPPEPERLERLARFMESRGVNVPEDIVENPAHALNAIIRQIRGKHQGQVLQTILLRTMKLAEYNPTNTGHFGLGSECYAHFTSPIRRYADLVVHQRLTKLLKQPHLEPEHFNDEGMGDVCQHISAKERASASAEKTFVRMKLLRRLREELGNEFEGVITEVKNFGFFVLLDDWCVDGLVSVDRLNDDRYEYNGDTVTMVGRRTGRQFTVGDVITVRVENVDLIGRNVDLGPTSLGAPIRRQSHAHRGKKAFQAKAARAAKSGRKSGKPDKAGKGPKGPKGNKGGKRKKRR